MTSGSFRSVSRPRDRRKSQSARLRVLANQSEAALDRSETFLRNQDPTRTCRVRYSITSSARASSDGGTSRPSNLAVCRLMANSNLVDCKTGRSAGFAPLRI
jgi:hypothetical protein